jgi:hypothetical protein
MELGLKTALRFPAMLAGLLMLVSVSSYGQSGESNVKPDLSKLSLEQLKTCLHAPKVCANDRWEVDDELVRRLPRISSEQLLACFENWEICGVTEDMASGWPISDELARRGNPHDLLVRYWKERKWTIRGGIEHVAYHFDSSEVTAFMRRVVVERKGGVDRYWPVNYLAKQCDLTALKKLSSGRYDNQNSLQYATSLELFGKCKYRPAIPYLVTTATHDVSLNIVAAAEHSLQALYPDHPKDFGTLEEEQEYYCTRARQEGLKLRCYMK